MIDYRGPDIAAIRPSDLARRLGFVAVWRGRPINLVGGKPLGGTASNGVTPVLTHLGPAYSLSGSGTGGISMSPVPDSAAFTMLVMARSITSGSSALGRVMSTFNGGGGNDWYYDGGNHQIQVFTASTNSTFTLPSSLLTGSTFQCVAISLSGVVGAQTPIAYADGVPVTVSTVAAGSGARVAGGTTLGVGYRPDTTGRQAGGVFVLAAYATRHLSARELAQVTARPNLLLAPRRIWVPVSSGLTAVESDFTASYSVVASLTKDFAASYTVVAAVQKDIAAAYDVQVAVSKDLAASYSVVASVSSDLAASYNVIAAVSKDLAAAYDVQVAVSKDLAAAYSVIAPVVSDLTASYNVIAAVQKDIAAAYDVVAAVQKDIAAAYDVVAAVSKDLSATYELLGDSTVVADFIGAYSVVGAVQKDLAASYSVFESAQQDLAASYTVFEAIAADLSASYTVIASAQQDLAASYTVFKAVQQDLAASYTVIAAVVQNLTAAYDIESAGGGTGATAEQIAAAVWARIGEDGMPYGDIMRVFLAALAGRTQGIGTPNERYLSADGSKARIDALFDANNNRVAVTLDGSP